MSQTGKDLIPERFKEFLLRTILTEVLYCALQEDQGSRELVALGNLLHDTYLVTTQDPRFEHYTDMINIINITEFVRNEGEIGNGS